MKKTTKILSLILLMVVAMSLIGCGKKDTSDQLIGTWGLTFDYSAVIEEEFSGSDFDGFHEEFDLTVLLTFNDDGTYAMYIDEEALAPVLEKYLDSMASYATDVTYEQSGLSKEEADEAWRQAYGMDVATYWAEMFGDLVTVEEISGEMHTEGVYEAKGNEVHMDEYKVQDNAYDIFKVEGDTLTITLPEGAEVEPAGIEGFDYPYIFTRVAQ